MAGKKCKKTKAAAADAVTTTNQPMQQDDEDVPLIVRVLIIGVTSFLAEHIWSNRKVVSEMWYSESQTPAQQNLIVAFEYMGAMGALLLMGVIVGLLMTKAVVLLRRIRGMVM